MMLRRVLLVGCATAGVVVVTASLVANADDGAGSTVSAEAVITPVRLDVDMATLRTYANSWFDSPWVADAVVAEYGGQSSGSVVPDRVSLVIDPDGTLRVVGHADDAETAAGLADTAAAAFVSKLNELGRLDLPGDPEPLTEEWRHTLSHGLGVELGPLGEFAVAEWAD